MASQIRPNLASMSQDLAPRHALRPSPLLAGLILALGAVGAGACGGKSPGAADTGAVLAAGARVDRSRCNDSGKQVVSADTDQDKKADVVKMYTTGTVNGQKVQVLACKQVDLNHDAKMDIIYHYDPAGAVSFE